MPCSVLKWNLHHTRSPAALMRLYVWLPYPLRCRYDLGKPRPENRIVT